MPLLTPLSLLPASRSVPTSPARAPASRSPSPLRSVLPAVVLLAACVPPAWAPPLHGVAPPVLVDPAPGTAEAPPTVDAPPGPRLTIYVHGWGGRFHGGDRDDAAAGVSSSIRNFGLAYADLPAFEGTQDEWTQMMACARRHFTGLPVELTHDRPATDDYLMVIVGGRASDLNTTGAWGWASQGDHAVIERGVGFVMSADHQVADRAGALCESLAHEIGHLLGVAHTDDCRDLMSNNRACARVGFLDHSRGVLEASLARWGEVVGLPMPARVSGIVGEPAEATGLVTELGAVYLEAGTGMRRLPAVVRAPRPIARAMMYMVLPDRLRSEYHCLPDGSDCVVVGDRIVADRWLTDGGEHHVLFEVHYADGEVRRTPWVAVNVP